MRFLETIVNLSFGLSLLLDRVVVWIFLSCLQSLHTSTWRQLAQAIGYEAIRQNFLVLYRSIFDLVRDFMKDQAFNQQDKTLRRYENKATIMTSNRPLEEWGKLLCDVPTAGAIIDRFLHHAQVVAITGKSYRVKEAPVVTQETKKGRKSNEPSAAEGAS